VKRWNEDSAQAFIKGSFFANALRRMCARARARLRFKEKHANSKTLEIGPLEPGTERR
jgi:hypothetical protein